MTDKNGWWILVDKDGLIIAGEGRSKEDLEYFAAVITFAIISLRKAIREEMGSEISEISFKVPERGLVFHVLSLKGGNLFLITAMPESMPLGMIRLKTKEIYERAEKIVESLGTRKG